MTLEERIKQMLEESAKQPEVVVEKQQELKSLSEEELEAMSQEEFDAIDEEQLDELSKDTLANYVKKATPLVPLAKKPENRAGSINRAKVKMQYTESSTEEDSEVVVEDKMANLKAIAAKDKQENKDREDDYLDDDGKTAKKAKLSKEVAAARKLVKSNESSEVSSQVSALLEAEGLSEEFKVQAVTIFEAAVTDRVLQIQEELEAQYNEKLEEATAEIEQNIDGFLTEAVHEWSAHNEVAIEANFKSRLAESFMDGIQSLMAEHNIELPEDAEDALEVALNQVEKLEESAEEVQTTIAQLQEQVNELKAEKILESFKERMTSTEFDRFSQLTESVKYKDETQYEKQLTIVLENFGKQLTSKQKVVKESAPAVITEEIVATPAETIVTEQYSNVNVYANYLASRAGKI